MHLLFLLAYRLVVCGALSLDWCAAGLLALGCPVSVVVSAIVHVVPQQYKVFQVFLVFCFVPVDVGGL